MMAVNENSTDVSVPPAVAMIAAIASTARPASHASRLRDNSVERTAFQPSGTLLSPAAALPWLLGFLGVAACVAPWLPHGWRWFEAIAVSVFLVAGYEALTLWFARKGFTPVLLSSKEKLRGCEGQSMQLHLALAGSRQRRVRREVRLALMAATRESESAISVKSGPQHFRLERFDPAEQRPDPASGALTHLWPWTPEVALLRRGLWPVPRVGIEWRSRFAIWRLRQWFDSPAQLRIDADLRPGRRGILRSPVYRALVAARQAPWTGQGREFERLREYQPGDNYAEIAWKSTARRGVPVTRLFQWEQKQEVYFVVDQSRASASPIDRIFDTDANILQLRAPRRLLDLAVETALVGATVALELGDEFGLVTYADEPKTWLQAGSGQFQFRQFRDRLLNLEPLPTTADYERLFSTIRLRLRRRAYLVLLADLAERSLSDSMRRGVTLLGTSHVVLMTSVLPAHARPAFSPGEQPRTDQDVYAALAGEKENQRLAALARQLRQLGSELRFVSPENFLRTAVEGYLESKREQRV
jgi:uncharacterized protein (DUF58 family)